MMKLVWLDSAVNDLVRLRAFVAKENNDAAKRSADGIRDATKRLIEVPFLGKPIEGLPDYRDMLIRFGAGGYVLRYRIHESAIYVAHIRHYREDDFKII